MGLHNTSNVQSPRLSFKEHDVGVNVPDAHESTDLSVALAVRDALRAVLVPHGRLRATVSNGVVTLEGTVSYLSQYKDAGRRVANLAGVRAVNNLVAVWPSLPRLTPLTIRCAIEQALSHHKGDAARRVQIVLAAGVVTLSGEVV